MANIEFKKMAKWQRKNGKEFSQTLTSASRSSAMEAISAESVALAEVSPAIVSMDSQSSFFSSALVGEGPVTAAWAGW